MSLVKNLKIKFVDFELNISEAQILDQGITLLWGPSGIGKTTFLRVLLGLNFVPEMEWIFAGEDLNKLPPAERNISVVFQSLELFPHMSAYENIEFASKAKKQSQKEFAERLSNITSQLDIQNILQRNVEKLSGGERQRVALARALIVKPRILFLDEPFSSLDSQNKEKARKLVQEVLNKEQIPALIVSHDPEDKALASHTIHL